MFPVVPLVICPGLDCIKPGNHKSTCLQSQGGYPITMFEVAYRTPEMLSILESLQASYPICSRLGPATLRAICPQTPFYVEFGQ